MQAGASTWYRCMHTTVKELHLNRTVYRILSIISHVLTLLNVLALFVISNLRYIGVKNTFWNYLGTLLWKSCRNTDINWHKLYERQYKSNASCFFSETIIYNGNEIYIYHGVHPLQSWDYFSTKSASFSEICYISAYHHPQNSILRVCLSGAWKDGIWRWLYQDCEENVDLIHLPLWLNIWICRFNFVNACTNCSELIVALLFTKFADKIPSVWQKTLSTILPTEVCTLNLFVLIFPTVPI
jgi:hypothetical protein